MILTLLLYPLILAEKKYLSKDFSGDLLKDIKNELNDIIEKKWSIEEEISSSMRRFLRCNNDNQWDIQNENGWNRIEA